MASVRFNQSFHAESHDEPEAPVPVELVKENEAHVCFFGVNRRSRYPQMGQSTGWVETNRLDRLVFWYQWDYLLINQVKKIRASKIGHDNIYKNIYIYIYIITYVKILLIFWLLVPHCFLTFLLSIFGMVILSDQLALLWQISCSMSWDTAWVGKQVSGTITLVWQNPDNPRRKAMSIS